MALDGQGHLDAEVLKNRLISISGFTEELGYFKMSFPKSPNVKKSNHLVTIVQGIHRLKDKMMEGFRYGIASIKM